MIYCKNYNILLIFFLIMVLFNVEIIGPKLYGESLEDAVDILNNALAQLRKKNGPYLTLRGVQAAFKFAPHAIYTFDAQLLNPEGQLDFCIVELSVDLINTENSLIVISCSGVEKVRRIIHGKIFIYEDIAVN